MDVEEDEDAAEEDHDREEEANVEDDRASWEKAALVQVQVRDDADAWDSCEVAYVYEEEEEVRAVACDDHVVVLVDLDAQAVLAVVALIPVVVVD